MPKIRSRYSERHPVKLDTGSESFVQQQFKDDCDIHTIVDRFTRTGRLPVMEQRPLYGDFSDVADFQEAQNLIARTTEYFDLLPSDLRARFNNNPSEFLAFVNDPQNTEEAIKLGILAKAENQPVEPVKSSGKADPLPEQNKTPVGDSGDSGKTPKEVPA